MKQFFASIVMLIVLVGCNTLTGTRSHVGDPRSFLVYAAADKDVKTIIVSPPNLARKSDLAKSVTDNLNDSYSFLRTNFSIKDTGNMVRPYKVVFAFNPQFLTTSDEICKAPNSLKLSPPSERLIVVAVFCEDSVISEVTANVDYTGKNKDANLNDAIKQLAASLVPQEEPLKSLGE